MPASRTRTLKRAAVKQSLPLPLDRSACAAFSTALLDWYRLHARDLPWRREPDPYRTWVSEIMLQQTRVNAVLEHFRAFIECFPTAVALALASEEEVLSRWSGLGYYRRARMLHRAAKFLLQEHEGTLPRTAEELRKLPGIGSYTGAAIASIAFGERIAVVDGNVERVLLRVAGRPEEANRETEDFVANFASALIEAPALPDPLDVAGATHPPGDHNQAMMELGATVCLPRAPRCLECPVIAWCATRGEHATPARAAMKSERVAYALVTRNPGGSRGVEVLLHRRSADLSLMPGMLELPTLVDLPESEPALRLRHAIVGTNYYAEIFAMGQRREVHRRMASSRETDWYEAAKLNRLPLTGLARKVLQRVGVMATAALLPVNRSVAAAGTEDEADSGDEMPLLIGIHGLVSDGTEDPVIPTSRAGNRKAIGARTAAQNDSAQGENMAIENKGNATWNGGLKDGKGSVSTGTGVLRDQSYTFASRFEKADKGTNPEELIAAAHAACFSMALSAELEKAGHKGDEVKTEATLTLDFVNGAPTVTKIHLVTQAKVPGIDAAKFDEISKGAKENCPISRLLKAAEITLDATLV